MPGTTTTYGIAYAEAGDEVNKFTGQVSEPGAKTIDKVLTEKILVVKKYVGGATLKAGELAVQEKTAETFTLPLAATENQDIGITSLVAETKITTSGGASIKGDFLEASTMKLSTNQHVRLTSAGGAWLIVAGEPKREQVYAALKSYTAVEAEAGVEPSATRPTFVSLQLAGPNGEAGFAATLQIGATTIAQFQVGKSTGVVEVKEISYGFFLPPGQKWKLTALTTVNAIAASYLTL